MDTERITRYLELKKQVAAIEAQIEELKPVVLEEVRAHKSRMQYEGYDFIVQSMTTWMFSPTIQHLQAALTEAKRNEKATGVASIKEQRDILIVRKHRDRRGSTASDDRMEQVRKVHPRAYEKWTAEEDEFLRAEFEHGQTMQTLAEQLQRQVGGIRSRLMKHGLLEK